MDQRLELAAKNGNTEQLYELLEEDPYVLEQFNSVPFAETPLHIAAAWGHIEFAIQIMNLKPSFAKTLNPSLYSPIHIALEKGHFGLVRWLLKCDKELVRVKGRDGKTAFHYAVEIGNADLMIEFLKVCPGCVVDLTNKGENGLHIAVNGNSLTVVKVLVGWLQRNCHKDAWKMEDEVINGKDLRGNTVLHTAAYKNSHPMLKSLLSCRNIKNGILNLEGLTAQDIVNHTTQTETGQMIDIETQRLIELLETPKSSSTSDSEIYYKFFIPKVSFHKEKLISALRARANMTEGKSNALLVVAALIFTVGFQAMFSPQGGVHQSHDKVGKTVMRGKVFVVYWCFNTLAVASVFFVTIYLLPPGSMALLFNVALLFLLNSYIVCVGVVSPFAFLSDVTFVLFLIPYLYIVYYWFFLIKMQDHWLF